MSSVVLVGQLTGDLTEARINNSYADTAGHRKQPKSVVWSGKSPVTGTDGITDSYAAGVVRAVAETDMGTGPYAGGLVARLQQGSSHIDSPNVRNSYAIANVIPATRRNYVGGFDW